MKNNIEVIKSIYKTLDYAVKDKRTEYTHRVEEGNQEWKETLNREQQLQFICEVVSEILVNNFEWENENELGN
ncbi:hypothetical protein [Staphylococcus sp. Marseille-Q5304]|uniref:TscA family type II toxin-antitoxin system antitoxin n=1 Tax=Staphylococcus sp. Marseille-Q5304 TaxID=2942200 RepID=UPI002074057D|nr:hypothetical protein [Staphylococcus sp. Marseille-Q5304]